MRACLIFNPAARGRKALRFHGFLAQLPAEIEIRPTGAPGDARRLAREAILQGHDRVIAAGGDGTVFEIINGFADVPGAFDRAVLGILPLGTANVLAHEIGMPTEITRAWTTLQSATPHRIDLGRAEFRDPDGRPATRRFAVVAGAGLDARAVQLVQPRLKERLGKLAYVLAALQACFRHPDLVRSRVAGAPFVGRVLLAGNGRFYAGAIPVFEDGRLDSGLLHVRGVRRIRWTTLARCLRAYLTSRWTLADEIVSETARSVLWEADSHVPLELDGEFAGWLPARLEIEPGRLSLLFPLNRAPSRESSGTGPSNGACHVPSEPASCHEPPASPRGVGQHD